MDDNRQCFELELLNNGRNVCDTLSMEIAGFLKITLSNVAYPAPHDQPFPLLANLQ